MITMIKKLLSPLFVDQLATSRAARPMLNELAEELDAIAIHLNLREADSIDNIVRFFQVIATVQDSGILKPVISELSQYPKYELLVERLDILDAHLTNAGRDLHGLNRTVVGEVVTDDNVFLGGTNGWWTKSVAYIKAHQDEMDFYYAMEKQARQFMEGHIGSMIHLIRRFDQALSA